MIIREKHAGQHDENNDETSRSSETAAEAQHKLKTHKILFRKERPAYPVVILPKIITCSSTFI